MHRSLLFVFLLLWSTVCVVAQRPDGLPADRVYRDKPWRFGVMYLHMTANSQPLQEVPTFVVDGVVDRTNASSTHAFYTLGYSMFTYEQGGEQVSAQSLNLGYWQMWDLTVLPVSLFYSVGATIGLSASVNTPGASASVSSGVMGMFGPGFHFQISDLSVHVFGAFQYTSARTSVRAEGSTYDSAIGAPANFWLGAMVTM